MVGGADISIKGLMHIGQNIRDGAFRHFDYGPQGNLQRYGTIQPPRFPLENIQVPIAMIQLEFNSLVREADLDLLEAELGDNVVYRHLYPINHDGLLLDRDEVKQPVIDDIISILESYESH